MSQIQIFTPPPTNWQDFQLLVAEIARTKYDPDSVQEFGRQGQKQYGVDIYATDYSDKKIGIQCKETKVNGLCKKIIDSEISQARNFRPMLDVYIIATTQRQDKNIQQYVNQINDKRENHFKVQVWFWDDINRFINLSQKVMFSFYKSYSDSFGIDEIKSHLSALRLAFDRRAFTDDFLHERNYDDFEQALIDTKALLKTGFLYDRRTRDLILQVIPYSYIGDESYQKFVQKIEKELEKIYQDFLKNKKASRKNPKQLEEFAGTYNTSRRKLIDVINKELTRTGQRAIDIAY